jgi:two-component system NarL family sensor kinase
MQDQYPEILIQFIATICIALLVVGFIVIIFKLYQKQKLVQEQELQNLKTAFEKELLQTQLEIQEDVLKNVSMEIHDNIGQVMLLANINLSMLNGMQIGNEALELTTETKKMLGKVSEDISQLSRSLNSDRITELGVFAAIIYELGLLARKKLFTVTIRDGYTNPGGDLPKETQLLVFRMFQEIINNIIKHAKASQVVLSIDKNEGNIELQISDNGVGFDFAPSAGTTSSYNGVGLRSLQSRVNLFKGSIDIRSVLREGTSISIFIPLTANQRTV